MKTTPLFCSSAYPVKHLFALQSMSDEQWEAIETLANDIGDTCVERYDDVANGINEVNQSRGMRMVAVFFANLRKVSRDTIAGLGVEPDDD